MSRSPKPEVPSYLKPMYNFPEHREVYSSVPQITIEKQWSSPQKTYNLKTSYANAFTTADNRPMRSTGRQIIDSGRYLGVPDKLNNKSKSLSNVAEIVTMDNAVYGRKLSPSMLNKTIHFNADRFESVVKEPNSMKVSIENKQWVKEKEKEKYAERFNHGEYIPSVTQMQIYGRKDPVSKFDKNELWKQRDLFNN